MCDPLVLARTPRTKTVGFPNLLGVAIARVQNKAPIRLFFSNFEYSCVKIVLVRSQRHLALIESRHSDDIENSVANIIHLSHKIRLISDHNSIISKIVKYLHIFQFRKALSTSKV